MPTHNDLRREWLIRQLDLDDPSLTINDLESLFYSYQGSDVRDYGAKPVPGFDNTTAFNAAFASDSKEIFVPQGTYEVSGQLNLPSDTSVWSKGAVLDFSRMANGTALNEKVGLKSAGTKNSPLTISNAITQWSRVITGISSTSTLAAGDLVLIQNTEPHAPGSVRTDRVKGELNVIKTVDSASQVTLETGAVFAYGITGLVIEKVNPVANVEIDGLVFKMKGIGSAHSGIRVEYGRNVRIRNCRVLGGEDKGISLASVYNGQVSKCVVRDSTSPSAIGNTGYGISPVEGSRYITIDGNYIENCRHFVAGGGYWPTVHVDVINNVGFKASDAGFDCHEPSYYWTFSRNRSIAAAGGITIRGQHINVEDNVVQDSTSFGIQAFAWDGVNEQRQIRINRNRIVRASQGILLEGLNKGGSTVDQWKYDCEIVGNRLISIYGSSTSTILARHFNRLLVADNQCDSTPTTAIDCRGLASGTPSRYLTVRGNIVRASPLQGLLVTFVDDVGGNVGQIIESVDRGVRFDTCNRVEINGLVVRNARLSGVDVVSCTNVGFTGGMITDITNTGVDGINFNLCTTVRVVGCTFQTQRAAVKTTSTNYVIVSNNDVHQCASGTKVNLDASAVNVVNVNNL